MMATIKDLRLHSRELLAVTQRGEAVTITYHGKPCARLAPYAPQQQPHDRKSRNPAFGLWRNRTATSVDEEVRKLRQPRSFPSSGE
ncbi:type II toxin-antitoxin system Phd/YefM family antitoxin [Aidingimonas lacisalsi]|uniref:type II toxin-antitoxin system Phd/YefM family antitoxin n=1 Tax=Aidingimonas lacisalsi TaxID=2604086 RepID=UPI0011D1DFFC